MKSWQALIGSFMVTNSTLIPLAGKPLRFEEKTSVFSGYESHNYISYALLREIYMK
jgi:hypothetical protein